MKVERIECLGSWRSIADAARTTVNMEPGTGEPSTTWKKKMLLAEHSPLRQMYIRWVWTDLPYWVSVHFVRHKIGIEHFVSTQRSDRTGVPRDELPQGALVRHECIANVQALINISRKRLCNLASKETREAWLKMLQELAKIEPEIVEACVPECIYRGFCPEMKPCGRRVDSDYVQDCIREYRQTN